MDPGLRRGDDSLERALKHRYEIRE
jgi:hypothetical protein